MVRAAEFCLPHVGDLKSQSEIGRNRVTQSSAVSLPDAPHRSRSALRYGKAQGPGRIVLPSSAAPLKVSSTALNKRSDPMGYAARGVVRALACVVSIAVFNAASVSRSFAQTPSSAGSNTAFGAGWQNGTPITPDRRGDRPVCGRLLKSPLRARSHDS